MQKTKNSHLDANSHTEMLAKESKTTFRNPLINRNFRWLWMGESVSLVGDQFYTVALPWLVLQQTGSLLALGTILFVGGLPRTVLMLVGGVISDRLSPRRIMLFTNLLRLAITTILTALVFVRLTPLWILYAISFCYGLVTAFFQPAALSVIPQLTSEDELQGSNALMQGSGLFAQAIGPGIAGMVVQALGTTMAFGIDAASFLFTSMTLSTIRAPERIRKPRSNNVTILSEITEMFRFIQKDPVLYPMILLALAQNLLFTGPLIIGPAALGKIRFTAQGSSAYGLMLSVFGVGTLLGLVWGGWARPRRLGLVFLGAISAVGACIIMLSIAPTLILVCIPMAGMGLAEGFMGVVLFSWIQKRIAREMMGRVMSLLSLAQVGLTPLSSAISGALANLSVPLMFASSGLLLILACLAAATKKDLRELRA